MVKLITAYETGSNREHECAPDPEQQCCRQGGALSSSNPSFFEGQVVLTLLPPVLQIIHHAANEVHAEPADPAFVQWGVEIGFRELP